MTNPTTELEHVIELLKKATTGPWRVGVGGYLFGEKYAVFTTNNDAAAIAAAVNFIREHGHTLLEAMRDAERLNYIERTYSGVTSQERYLPVQMIWGKGCNGRTLREACDKYMARDAAKENSND